MKGDAESEAPAVRQAVGGRSKKAKLKREAEEKERLEARQRALDAAYAALRPDGYVIIECRTSLMQAVDGHKDIISTIELRVVGSSDGVGSRYNPRPSPFDYLQMPDWLMKFFPSSNGVIAQDEVYFEMRNDPVTMDVLEVVEGDDVMNEVAALYERSRLSELSRPPDLRDVNVDIAGIVEIFLRDLVLKVWNDVLPELVRAHAAPLTDDFVRSYVLCRAFPDTATSLASSQLFSRGLQHALVLAVALRTSSRLKLQERWRHLLHEADAASRAAHDMAKREQARDKAHATAKKEKPYDYDPDVVNKEFETVLAKMAEEQSYESDVDELEKEGKTQGNVTTTAGAGAREKPRVDMSSLSTEQVQAIIKKNQELMQEAFARVEESIYTEELDAIISAAVSSAVEDEVKRRLLESLDPEEVEAQRIAESTLHMSRLARERIQLRRVLGEKIRFMSIQ